MKKPKGQPKKGKKQQITLHLPIELRERLRAYSERSRIPQTAILELALAAWLDQKEGKPLS